MNDREAPDSEFTHGRIFPTVYTAVKALKIFSNAAVRFRLRDQKPPK